MNSTRVRGGLHEGAIAILVFVGVALVLLAFSPLDLSGMGYSGEELAAAERLLAVTRGDSRPFDAPLLARNGIVTRHGFIEVVIKLPFLALGKMLARFRQGPTNFAERFVAIEPILMTAFLSMIVFLWSQRLTGSRRWGVAMAVGGVFCTFLWPYAYIGLETTQSAALILAAYMALGPDRPVGRGGTVAFTVATALAVSVKSNGVFLVPAGAFLVWQFFLRRRHLGQKTPVLTIVLCSLFILAMFSANAVLHSYWYPPGTQKVAALMFLQPNPITVVSNVLMLLFSGNKGIIIYAPIAFLGLFALPVVWKKNRKICILALLVLGGLAVGCSFLGVAVEESWGPRYLHCAVPILVVCLAAGWGQDALRTGRRVVLITALAIGLTVSSLGSLFYYGRLYQMAVLSEGATTIEALGGDPVWNHVTMNLRLAGIWLLPGKVPNIWKPKHSWWVNPPVGGPPEKSVDLGPIAYPQPLLLRRASDAPEAVRWLLAMSLVTGLGCLTLAGYSAKRSDDNRRSLVKPDLFSIEKQPRADT